MPKLCQCLWSNLDKKIAVTMAAGHTHISIVELAQMLEEDCVCSKEERPNLIRVYLGKEEVGKVHLTDGFCIFGKEYRVEYEHNHAVTVMESWDEHMSNKEKQSQSPCKHEWQQLFFNMPVSDQPSVVRGIQLPSWGCFKAGCGLVTCKNPNQE